MTRRARILTIVLALGLTLPAKAQTAPVSPVLPTAVDHAGTLHGPAAGHLVIVGGGPIPDEIWDSFVRFAGGPAARIVVITNASGSEEAYQGPALEALGSRVPDGRVTRLHLRDIDEANDPALIAPLEEADGVFFTGGRQWRIAEVYLNTRAHRALNAVLERGGVIGGTSAGASIQGSFLWRGDTRGPDITVGDHTQGLGFMKCTVIDQHLFARHREADLLPFIQAAPEYVGIGIDESTAVLVERDSIRVAGLSRVALYRPGLAAPLLLEPGEGFDLGGVPYSPGPEESAASAQDNAQNLRSDAENLPEAQKSGENLRSDAETPSQAQEIAQNLRSDAENLPEAQKSGENLRSDAENLPEAQKSGENLRSDAETPPQAQENAQNLRSDAKNLPEAQKSGENLRSDAENMSQAQEIGENLRSDAETPPQAQEIAQNLRFPDERFPDERFPDETFRPQQLIAPSALLAAGTFGALSPWYKDHVNAPVRAYAQQLSGGRQLGFDDWIQYLPIISYVGLGFFVRSDGQGLGTGARPEHGLPERLCVTATAYAAQGLMTNALKYTVREQRPDSDARNAFPSGHTATAFMGAELVRREYGPWWGAGAYAVATTTALMRLYNDRHWTNDLLGGAAIGILSADIGYWLLPLERRLFHIVPGSGKAFTVLPSPYGIAVSCVF